MSHPVSATIIDFYHKHAYEWDEIRQRRFLEKTWIDRFLSDIPPNSDIVDIGCGSGTPLGGYIINQGYNLTGIDSSSPLIELCVKRHPFSKWIIGDMRTLSLNKTFNRILVWDSFFHLTQDDQRKMFPIFKAHSRKGAMLMFTSGTYDGEVIGRLFGDDLYHASLSPEEYRNQLDSNGFDIIDYIENDLCCDRTIWLAKYR
ncbi:class I SAM-dependent DNA methyltransferase [Samsonia erythrinae]|uniref:2-polyprenyl-3-methyl-5-hydroxy-6-metoxy-1, 4-benzoquinol methylase n=1 Tax=Samsonia erythrinae TaxID=160434 RepID=A0A4R3VQM6_9GAMM|nr:class I SAM-dependent methyltransferase [Samsonia erythrinae]TCV06886.1 2-polyprenyl-3-methyl-5-hydroxy-6-metoxy-1,4-benzoquinol methylase [Samsonia erythrinae]